MYPVSEQPPPAATRLTPSARRARDVTERYSQFAFGTAVLVVLGALLPGSVQQAVGLTAVAGFVLADIYLFVGIVRSTNPRTWTFES